MILQAVSHQPQILRELVSAAIGSGLRGSLADTDKTVSNRGQKLAIKFAFRVGVHGCSSGRQGLPIALQCLAKSGASGHPATGRSKHFLKLRDIPQVTVKNHAASFFQRGFRRGRTHPRVAIPIAANPGAEADYRRQLAGRDTLAEDLFNSLGQIGVETFQSRNQKWPIVVESHGDFVFDRGVMATNLLRLPQGGNFAENRLLLPGGLSVEQQRPVERLQGPGDMLPLGASHPPRHLRRMGGKDRHDLNLPQPGHHLLGAEALRFQTGQSPAQGTRLVRRIGRQPHRPQTPFAVLGFRQIDQLEKSRKSLNDLPRIGQRQATNQFDRRLQLTTILPDPGIPFVMEQPPSMGDGTMPKFFLQVVNSLAGLLTNHCSEQLTQRTHIPPQRPLPQVTGKTGQLRQPGQGIIDFPVQFLHGYLPVVEESNELLNLGFPDCSLPAPVVGSRGPACPVNPLAKQEPLWNNI